MSERAVGLALLTLLFAGIVGVTVWAMGWRLALTVWGFALGVAALFVVGVLLVTV